MINEYYKGVSIELPDNYKDMKLFNVNCGFSVSSGICNIVTYYVFVEVNTDNKIITPLSYSYQRTMGKGLSVPMDKLSSSDKRRITKCVKALEFILKWGVVEKWFPVLYTKTSYYREPIQRGWACYIGKMVRIKNEGSESFYDYRANSLILIPATEKAEKLLNAYEDKLKDASDLYVELMKMQIKEG